MKRKRKTKKKRSKRRKITDKISSSKDKKLLKIISNIIKINKNLDDGECLLCKFFKSYANGCNFYCYNYHFKGDTSMRDVCSNVVCKDHITYCRGDCPYFTSQHCREHVNEKKVNICSNEECNNWFCENCSDMQHCEGPYRSKNKENSIWFTCDIDPYCSNDNGRDPLCRSCVRRCNKCKKMICVSCDPKDSDESSDDYLCKKCISNIKHV